MFTEFTEAQKDVFKNLDDFGFATVLYLPDNAPGLNCYYYNIYENGLDEPALAIGYATLMLDGIIFPPFLLERRRVFEGGETPPEEE